MSLNKRLFKVGQFWASSGPDRLVFSGQNSNLTATSGVVSSCHPYTTSVDPSSFLRTKSKHPQPTITTLGILDNQHRDENDTDFYAIPSLIVQPRVHSFHLRRRRARPFRSLSIPHSSIHSRPSKPRIGELGKARGGNRCADWRPTQVEV